MRLTITDTSCCMVNTIPNNDEYEVYELYIDGYIHRCFMPFACETTGYVRPWSITFYPYEQMKRLLRLLSEVGILCEDTTIRWVDAYRFSIYHQTYPHYRLDIQLMHQVVKLQYYSDPPFFIRWVDENDTSKLVGVLNILHIHLNRSNDDVYTI